MDPRERTTDPQVAMGASLDGRQAQIWTALPGVIESVDFGKLTASVQPTIQGQFRNTKGVWQNQTMPLLVDCPVLFPGGGGFLMTFPLAAGDEVLVHFSSRCFDAWWQQGGVQPQAQFRMHDLSDGFVAPKLYSLPNIPGSVSGNSAQLRTKDGTAYIELASGGIVNIVAPGGLNINGKTVTTGDVVVGPNSISVETHVHGSVQPGNGDTGEPVT